MRWTLLVVLLLCVFPAAGETYILPMYGMAGGAWHPRIAVLNPGDQPVTLRVVRGYPMITGQCFICYEQPELTIEPKRMITLRPFWSDTKDYVVAGSYELESSGPLLIEVMYFGYRIAEIRQQLDVARAWLPAGEHLALAQSGIDVRHNVVVVNPNAFSIEVDVWRFAREDDGIRIQVPPRSTRMVLLAAPSCGGEECPPYPDYPPPPDLVHFDSPAPFLGGVSSIGASWAVFGLAGQTN